jgi:hypothetical protein
MTRDALVAILIDMPSRLAAAEETLLTAEEQLTSARGLLHDRESCLLFAGLDGKNEAVRSAKLRADTSEERELVLAAERNVDRAGMELRLVRAEFSAAKAMARLLAGGEER